MKNKPQKLVLSLASLLVSTMAAAQNSSSAAVTTVAAAPAATTSTATVTPAPANSPLGRFGLGVTFDTVISDDAIKRIGSDNIGKDGATAESINYATVNYKLNDTDKVAVRQYWRQNFGPQADRNGKLDWTVLTYSTKTKKGLWGSEPVAPLFWYYMPTTENKFLGNGIGDDQFRTNGNLRLDAEVMWNLTPKWAVSYYFNPRQSMIPGDEKIYKADGSLKDIVSSKTTLIHYAILYYNFTDSFQTYAFMGMRNVFLTNNGFYNSQNNGLPALGAYWSISKNMYINAEINQEVPLKSTSYSEAADKSIQRQTQNVDSAWLDNHDLSYELVIGLSI